MRSRSLSFADALQLLGDPTDPTVERLGRLAGLGAGAVTVATAGTVDFFALRDEAVSWGNAVVTTIRERSRGLGRFDRDLDRIGEDSEFVSYPGVVLALLTSGPADHHPEVRRILFLRALRENRARHVVRLVLHRLVEEADVLAEDALVPIIGEISRWPHLAEERDLMAELIAAIRTRDPLSPVLQRWTQETASDDRMHRYLAAAGLKRGLSG